MRTSSVSESPTPSTARACQFCGGEIPPFKRSIAKFCRDRCRLDAWRQRVRDARPLRTCARWGCDNPLRSKRKNGLYCSVACGNAQRSAERHQRTERCPICKEYFTPKIGNQKYCTTGCKYKAKWKRTRSNPKRLAAHKAHNQRWRRENLDYVAGYMRRYREGLALEGGTPTEGEGLQPGQGVPAPEGGTQGGEYPTPTALPLPTTHPPTTGIDAKRAAAADAITDTVWY